MATNLHIQQRGARRRIVLFVVLTGVVTSASGSEPLAPQRPQDGSGNAGRLNPSKRPAVNAAFTRESYTPGERARLVFFSGARRVTVRPFRAGADFGPTRNSEMRGRAVAPAEALGSVVVGRSVRIQVGNWATGLYYARITAAGGKVGYAPFVVRAGRLGAHNVAVVLPTFTWQAYNFSDDDGDGDADTWYAGADERTARLGRPYEGRGAPPHYAHYDQPFLRWLYHTRRDVDYLTDSDLDRIGDGRVLAQAYDLIVFPGHHEYVTEREFDAVTRYRDLGGNLMFLSANNFYWRVDVRGRTMTRIRHWRELGKPEAALIGVQYIDNDEGEHRGPWIVRSRRPGWLFAGTGLRPGSRLSSGGIEIDKTASSSPPGTKVLAEIPNLLGPGMTAQMTYYETRRGAKVFAAGAFTLAGAVWQADVRRLVENLWARLAA